MTTDPVHTFGEHDEGCVRLLTHDGPCATSLDAREAAAMPSESGHGVTLCGWYPYWPGTPCLHCGKFVGRDGSFEVEHFEMSMSIASVEGFCRRCNEAERCAECRYPIERHDGAWRHIGAGWKHDARPQEVTA